MKAEFSNDRFGFIGWQHAAAYWLQDSHRAAMMMTTREITTIRQPLATWASNSLSRPSRDMTTVISAMKTDGWQAATATETRSPSHRTRWPYESRMKATMKATWKTTPTSD